GDTCQHPGSCAPCHARIFTHRHTVRRSGSSHAKVRKGTLRLRSSCATRFLRGTCLYGSQMAQQIGPKYRSHLCVTLREASVLTRLATQPYALPSLLRKRNFSCGSDPLAQVYCSSILTNERF